MLINMDDERVLAAVNAGSVPLVLIERKPPIAILKFNRPEALNALNDALIVDLARHLEDLDKDQEIRCVILTGGEKVFAAGADIREMAGRGASEMLRTDRLAKWEALRHMAKPLVAAVSGFALGGGCELALSCDIIIASQTAVFGQPEINIGVIPGAGGTQRLARALGKYRAMDMVLTGRRISAQEAFEFGLVSRVVPCADLMGEAERLALDIAAKPPLAMRLAKEAVIRAEDISLEAGLALERRFFYLLFSTEDQKEGMKAFLEKRPGKFQGK